MRIDAEGFGAYGAVGAVGHHGRLHIARSHSCRVTPQQLTVLNMQWPRFAEADCGFDTKGKPNHKSMKQYVRVYACSAVGSGFTNRDVRRKDLTSDQGFRDLCSEAGIFQVYMILCFSVYGKEYETTILLRILATPLQYWRV